jgi:uncharacterized protein YcaQ
MSAAAKPRTRATARAVSRGETSARTPVFPHAAVAGLFLERQHLDRPRQRRLTPAALVRFTEDVGGIQLDSINVLERAHRLTLWSRFGTYDRTALDRLVYHERLLFEYWAHAACLVPTTHFPAWRRAMLDYEVRHTGWTRFLRKHRRTLERVEAAFRERGPLGNADFADTRKRRPASGWWTWKPENHAIDYLWKKGVLAVHSRVHFQRRLDVLDRVLPRALEQVPLSRDEFRTWHLRRALHALGAASESDLRLYFTFPRLGVTERRSILRSRVRAGEVVEVAIEGERAPWYALAEDLPALAAAARRRTRGRGPRVPPASRGTTLLSPFDSFLWHRERTNKLFGFDYRIEVYTPGHQRVHGYYSLPILHDGALIGRLDAKNHRDERRLEVRHVSFEPWFAAGGPAPVPARGHERVAIEPALAGIADALRSLAAFLEAERIAPGRVSPPALAEPLRRALADRGKEEKAGNMGG